MSAILTFSVNVGVSCGRGTIYSLCMGYGPGRYLCWAVPGLTLGAHSLHHPLVTLEFSSDWRFMLQSWATVGLWGS